MIRKALVKRGGQIVEVTIDDSTYKDGGSNMIKRKDGSYSQRGLWDNIRANKGSGKKPTKQMLEQERKIKRNKKQTGGEEIYGNYMLPEFEITENTGMYNPNIVGPSAPRYIPSETGFVPNPYYTTGSGSAESVPLEMFAAPIMRGASSLIGMIPQNVMTGLGAGTILGLEGCAPGQKCKGLDALPQRTKYKTSKRKKRRRQEGGEEDFYTPDTGIEQFAPDQSWYEGNPNASAPGNIVSWPSYPKGTGIPISELPAEAMPQRIPSSQGSIYLGTGRYAGIPSNPMLSLDNNYSRYQEDMPEYRRSFDLFNRIGQGFNNMGEAIGNGFDNLSDFFQRMKKNRKRARRERRGRRGNGLKSCKSGVGCAKFIKQEGGEESDQMEEILDQIEDALEQGVKSEEILLQLTEMGIDEEQAQMLIEEAIQDLQEDAQEEEGNGEEKEMEDDEMYASGGSYRVYRTSERKGKTHKVVGPGGVTKYFGDPKLGERSKSKYGKKGFYARHKKNLAKNPFFRAYARATWAEGGEPTFMNEPEFKTNSFVDLIKSEAENNAYKNIMNQAQEMFMQMGGMTDYGYTGPSELSEMYQKNLNDLQSKGNVEGAVVNAANQVGLALEKGIQMAANVVAPGSGAIVGAAMDAGRPKSITDPTSKGFSAEGIGSMLKGLASDPQALAGLVARYGGSMRKFQAGAQTSVPGFTSDMTVDPWSNWGLNQNNIALPQQPQQYITADQSLNTPSLTATPDNLGVWSDDMTTYTPASFGPKNQMEQPGVSTEGTNPNKDPLLKPAVQQPKTQMPGGGIDWLSIGKDIVTAMAYRGKAKKTKAKMADMNAGDNVFAAAETLNRGDFDRNTGRLKPDQYIMGTTQGIPALARYGGGLRRAQDGLENAILFSGDRHVENYLPVGNNQKSITNEYFRNINYYPNMPADTTYGYVSAPGGNQYIINSRLTPKSERDLLKEEMIKRKLNIKKHGGVQKDGVYMSYPTATPESVVYGEQPKKPSNTLQPVKRELANLEAEDGETAITPAGVDGVPKFWKIGGERHSNGGTPLNLPDGSFIFSDTKSMKLGGDILEELGIKGKKKKTPAEISKILGKGYEKFVMIIQDPNSDKIERRTAELMIENQIKKLGMLALAQESKKGFPEGIPMIAVPYMESVGIAPEQILPQPQMGMEEMGMPQQMPMAKYGMQKYQTGREKQTDILGMDPNAPFPISSVSTPDNPNIAERILGPLFKYFASEPKETPIETNIQPVEIFAPVKGFESIEDLDKFITKGDEFGEDFNALYSDYSQTLQTIDGLKKRLIENRIPLEEYEKEAEGINNRIGEIKTQIVESKERLPYSSWSIIPGSTANKLADLSDILDEEKEKLEFRASDLRKFRNFQNNVSFLETEKQNILQLLNSDIDNLERMRLKRRLTDLNDALNYESDRLTQFGEKAFKTFSTNLSETSPNEPVIVSRTGLIKGTLIPKNIYGEMKPNFLLPSLEATRKFTYDDYLKQYDSSPITSKAKPSYESQQGSLNAVQDTVPAVQDTVPVVAPSTPAPTQSKPKSSKKQVQKKPSLNIKVVSEEDKQYF